MPRSRLTISAITDKESAPTALRAATARLMHRIRVANFSTGVGGGGLGTPLVSKNGETGQVKMTWRRKVAQEARATARSAAVIGSNITSGMKTGTTECGMKITTTKHHHPPTGPLPPTPATARLWNT